MVDAVTILTICKGRLAHLKQSVPRLLAQDSPIPFSVLVVDYGCPDGTWRWCLDQNNPRLNCLRVLDGVEFIDRSRARNCGIQAARSKWIWIVDADFLPEPFLLRKMLEPILAGEAEATLLARPTGNQESHTHLVFPREQFFALRGYDESFVGWGYEEVDFLFRMQAAINVKSLDIPEGCQFVQHDNAARVQYQPAGLENIKRTDRANRRRAESRTGPVNPRGFGKCDFVASRGVLTAANAEYFPGLQILSDSIRQTESWPLCCVDLGLTDEQRDWCRQQEIYLLPIAGASVPREVWEGFGSREQLLWIRPWLIAASPFADLIWLDADTVVTRPLGELFERINHGMVLFSDRYNPAATFNKPSLYDLLPVSTVTDKQANAGVLGLRHERELSVLDAWKNCISAAAADRGVRRAIAWWDQGSLLWALHATGRTNEVVDDPTWNYPANGLENPQRKERKRYSAGDDLLAAIQRDHPAAGIVHYMDRPKLWELID